MLSSPPHHEQIKIKQFSVKTNWRFEKDSHTTKAKKKDPHRIRYEGKKRDKAGTCTPRRRHKEEIHPPWGVSSVSHMLGTPALGSDSRQMSPFGWFEDQWV